MNFLEQLVAEWYAYQGYFVRTNVRCGKTNHGGYEGEMDVVAFDIKNKVLIHLEVSGDSYTWEKRQERFRKKFEIAAKHYRTVFNFDFKEIRKVVVVGYSRPRKSIRIGDDVELVLIPDLMNEITDKMKELDPMKVVIPEGYPLLRAIQFAVTLSKKGSSGNKTRRPKG
ncbi:MAG: hypothetical protein E3J71_05750 [Candidatus Stahlbacteria bacterium]|nr:MAG: hypothetical protein E3J71_05750 [Candidatus Stahlbacteria bacterium]